MFRWTYGYQNMAAIHISCRDTFHYWISSIAAHESLAHPLGMDPNCKPCIVFFHLHKKRPHFLAADYHILGLPLKLRHRTYVNIHCIPSSCPIDHRSVAVDLLSVHTIDFDTTKIQFNYYKSADLEILNFLLYLFLPCVGHNSYRQRLDAIGSRIHHLPNTKAANRFHPFSSKLLPFHRLYWTASDIVNRHCTWHQLVNPDKSTLPFQLVDRPGNCQDLGWNRKKKM